MPLHPLVIPKGSNESTGPTWIQGNPQQSFVAKTVCRTLNNRLREHVGIITIPRMDDLHLDDYLATIQLWMIIAWFSLSPRPMVYTSLAIQGSRKSLRNTGRDVPCNDQYMPNWIWVPRNFLCFSVCDNLVCSSGILISSKINRHCNDCPVIRHAAIMPAYFPE